MSPADGTPNFPKRAAPTKVGASLALPEREEKILEFWEQNKIFEKTLAKTLRQAQGKPGRRFVFYEGPPYANGLPGIHHFEARVFKDIIIRYRTMRGFYVPRKAGWDTHGLPIEIAVEKELGVKTKSDIEQKIGIGKFVDAARRSVFRYKAEWERFTRRIGYWLDLEGAYMTMSTDYIETLWWIIKEIWKKGLLYQDFKVVPWCPRCQTPLSSHEVGFGYQTVKDRSIYVRFRLKSTAEEWEHTSILSWTTTPWTLPGNVALAVNPNELYVCVPDPVQRDQWLVLGQKPFRHLLEKGFFPSEYRTLTAPNIDVFEGKEILGIEYEPLFSVSQLRSPKSHRLYPADFVNMEEGTGVVHTAVMYGEDDYRLGTKVGLPKFHTVTETGHFIDSLGEGLGGLPVKDPKTEEKIIESLTRRGLLFREELYEHEYPFCWRCETALLYYAREGWWIKMTAVKQKLLANNETINWIPETIKHGRFGEFLNEVRDWAFSRERYWGTPLPVWKCEKCRHQEVIGSLEELARRAPKSGNRYLALRHGQSETQLLGIADDDLESFHLTPRGKREVRAQAARLRRSEIDLVITSPILRTRESAEILSEALGVSLKTEERLREIHVGVFEHKPTREYRQYFSSRMEMFTKRPPEGESLNDLKARLMAFMVDLERQYRNKTILLVSHEYPIWILWGAAQGLSSEKIAEAKEKKRDDFVKTGEVIKIPFLLLPRDETGAVNLHRPFADSFLLICPKCRATLRRVPEVVDVWFDSGAMPFAQHHYPFAHKADLPYPADYICEGVDMTRGWFYTLLAVASVLGRKAPYRNVISLGLVLDKNSQKMSKSRGNVVDPNAVIAKYGVDTIRWYFYTVNAPGDSKRFNEGDLLLKLRGTPATFWNAFVFFDTYVKKAQPERGARPTQTFDQWLVNARLEQVTREVTERLDRYDIGGAARTLENFILNDFSNWYLRRSRRRFQRPETATEKSEAEAVLAHVLLRLTKLMAPFTPFLAEIIYQELRKKMKLREESVHLAAWPEAHPRASDPKFTQLFSLMEEGRRIVALALAERARVGMKVRQPLQQLSVKSALLDGKEWVLNLIRDEVNVKEVSVDPKIAGDILLDTTLTEELREEGFIRDLIRNIQEMRRDLGLKPSQPIRCQVSGDAAATAIVEKWGKLVKRETNTRTLVIGGKRVFRATREISFPSGTLWVGIAPRY